MSVRAFGEGAARIAQRLSGPETIIACEPGHAGAAIGAAVDLRRRGQHFWALIVTEDERVRLTRDTSIALVARLGSWDEVRLTLHDFAEKLDDQGRIPLTAGDRASLHEFVRLADGLMVRSQTERVRIETALGTIPRDVDVVVVDPQLERTAPAEPTDIVIYAPDERGDALGTYITAVLDVGLPLALVARDAPRLPSAMRFVPPDNAPHALARARVIVDGTGDPGTARALARLGRPLAVSSRSGATELLRGVAVFEPWQRPSIVAAVGDALGAAAPQVRDPQPPQVPSAPPMIDRIGAAAPLVSVIVTTYNRPIILADTLATIERQTYPSLEIVVVNDAGSDVSEIVKPFPRARVIDHTENRGPAAGRNTGLRAARGEYVIFFDDDDEMFPDHLGALAGALERSGLDVAYGQMINGFATLAPDGHYQINAVLAHYALLDNAEIQWGGNLATTAVMFRRRLIDTIGFVDESLAANEDFEFWIRLAAGRAWARVPEVTSLYVVRTDGSNRSSQNAKARYRLAHETIFAKHPTDRPMVNAGRSAMLNLFA